MTGTATASPPSKGRATLAETVFGVDASGVPDLEDTIQNHPLLYGVNSEDKKIVVQNLSSDDREVLFNSNSVSYLNGMRQGRVNLRGTPLSTVAYMPNGEYDPTHMIHLPTAYELPRLVINPRAANQNGVVHSPEIVQSTQLGSGIYRYMFEDTQMEFTRYYSTEEQPSYPGVPDERVGPRMAREQTTATVTPYLLSLRHKDYKIVDDRRDN
jgi:hypothetical protein